MTHEDLQKLPRETTILFPSDLHLPLLTGPSSGVSCTTLMGREVVAKVSSDGLVYST